MAIDHGKVDDVGVSDEERSKRRAVLDKTTGKSLEKKWKDGDRAEIEMREKALAPPIITEPRCKVCTSQYRAYIERELVKGHGYQTIANSIPADENGKKPSRKSLAHHAKEHMPLDRMAIRAELEAEAEVLRQNYETGAQGAITDKGILKVFARKAYEDVINNVTTVEPKDAIQIIKLLNELNSNTAQIRNEETEVALRIFVRAIQNVCEPAMQAAIAAESKRLREMDEIDYRMEEAFIKPDPPQLVEAEAVVVEVDHEGTRPESDD